MVIRPAERSDLAPLAKLDKGPAAWDAVKLEEHVSSFGVVKLAEEGSWLLGWIAYRKVPELLVVDRLVVLEDRQAECAIALRLIRHLAMASEGCKAIDVVLEDDRTDLIKTLVSQGFSTVLVRDYFAKGEDAVALHKKLS